MFRLVGNCALAALILAACGGGQGEALSIGKENPVQTTAVEAGSGSGEFMSAMSVQGSTSVSFEDELLAFDSSRWHAADWYNGGYFLNGWHPNQLSFLEGRMHITLKADTEGLTGGRPAVSGEYRTNATYGHGLYKARLVASNVPGTITAFFTYTGLAEGTQHDEIDVEIKGDDPTRLHVNYWTDGVEHPTTIALGFDASAAPHDYAFRWTADGIQWFVDDRLVHEEKGSRGPLPQVAGRIMLSLWGAVGAQPWSSDYQVTGTPSRASVERVSFTAPEAASTIPVSVGALAGSAMADRKGWRAVATITVRDAGGRSVPGARVSGGFTVGGSGLGCTTDAAGVCSITSDNIAKTKAGTTFSVNGLSGPDLSYDAGGNASTSVTIARP